MTVKPVLLRHIDFELEEMSRRASGSIGCWKMRAFVPSGTYEISIFHVDDSGQYTVGGARFGNLDNAVEYAQGMLTGMAVKDGFYEPGPEDEEEKDNEHG